jgi:hypothetical protein
MSRNRILSNACWSLALMSVSLSPAAGQGYRKPLGVYAHMDIEAAISRKPCSNSTSTADLHTCLTTLYSGLLADEAVSGITAGAHWDDIQKSDPLCIFVNECASGTEDGYDWSYLDDVFAVANAAHKFVQLIITPGVDSPPWLLAKLPTCDGLFGPTGTAPADCGQVTFATFPESQRADGTPPVQPLPWNPLYILAWDDFLIHLNLRYRSNPAFVAIAVAGPICASTEMILPTAANKSTISTGLDADTVWKMLMAHSFPYFPIYQNSDQVFIDTWKQTIDAYEQVFSGVTLFLSPDSGSDMPELPAVIHDMTLFNADCSTSSLPQSCGAKTEVLSYFLSANGPNAKATQDGGMTASRSLKTGDIGIAGVKMLTAMDPTSFFGGAEFDFAVSDQTTLQQEGCPNYPTLCGLFGYPFTPEEADYNVLTVFFNGTNAATHYGGTRGPAPIQYLELDYTDIQFAQTNPCPTLPSTLPGAPSLQDLLNMASQDLFAIAGQLITLPPTICH